MMVTSNVHGVGKSTPSRVGGWVTLLVLLAGNRKLEPKSIVLSPCTSPILSSFLRTSATYLLGSETKVEQSSVAEQET